MGDIFEKYRTKKGEILLGDQYLILKKIGHGAFGDVYMVRCFKSGRSMAIKVERTSSNGPTWSLIHEFAVYQRLSDGYGFPETYGIYQEDKFHWLVMELLGPSLSDLLPRCNKRFSLKTTLMLADQLLERIEYVHRQGYIHRDIKPSNLMIGQMGSDSQRLYMIDFGLAKRYRNPKTGIHIEFTRNRPMTGTIGYNSINAMKRFEQSRRDDIESIGYVLIYLAKGRLPWHRITAKSNADLQKKVLQVKEKTPLEELCNGLPDVFIDYMRYVKKLKFEQRPDYNKLRDLFRVELRESGHINDLNFDWMRLKDNRRTRARSKSDRRNKSKKRNTTKSKEKES